MDDFLETAKQKLGRGITRVSWETDKLRRSQAKQGEVNKLKQDRDQVILDFSNTVLTLYRQGMLTDPKLQQYCERILEIEREMTTKSAELEQIRSEFYPGAQGARAGAGDAASAGASPKNAARQSAAGAPSAGRQVEMVPCPTCGEPVRVKALYCNKCGARLR
jgi:hypothetical protein